MAGVLQTGIGVIRDRLVRHLEVVRRQDFTADEGNNKRKDDF
ncbi:unnamed protein product [Meloidogyne enterolobii]|uniref:Uncharacterized protein n=1 Tax=Meloidogyne enterolobii TaxID=390850 RepID=A0ACB0ZPA5_MELEN